MPWVVLFVLIPLAIYGVLYASSVWKAYSSVRKSYDIKVAQTEETLRETGLDARGFVPTDIDCVFEPEAQSNRYLRMREYCPLIYKLTRKDGTHVTVLPYLLTALYDTDTGTAPCWDIVVADDGETYAVLYNDSQGSVCEVYVCEGEAIRPGFLNWMSTNNESCAIVLDQPVTKDALDTIATMSHDELKTTYGDRVQIGIELLGDEAG